MHPVYKAIAVGLLAGSPGPSVAQGSDADPSRDTAVAAVLELQDTINEAALNGDGEVFAEVLSEDFVASPPSNRISRREDLIGLFSSGQIAYASVEATVDFAEQLGDGLVVVMGTETTTQAAVPRESESGAQAAETVLRRRYTNVYRNENGVWRLLIKQSTAIGPD